jgi:hypothetical protein
MTDHGSPYHWDVHSYSKVVDTEEEASSQLDVLEGFPSVQSPTYIECNQLRVGTIESRYHVGGKAKETCHVKKNTNPLQNIICGRSASRFFQVDINPPVSNQLTTSVKSLQIFQLKIKVMQNLNRDNPVASSEARSPLMAMIPT